MVLEYCAGDELFNFLLKENRIKDEDVRKMFAQLSGAVAYTHKNNCVHRDLKLENILLDKAKNVKLSDFGFTRECEPRSLLDTVCGTSCYMAPEMLLKKSYHGQSIDVWSLGVILYTLIYGEMPFEEDSDIDTRRKIIEEEPRYPTLENVSPDAINLIKSMLMKDYKKRPNVIEILTHPYLSEHGPEQLTILSNSRPSLFSTQQEKRLLRHLRSCHIDIDLLIRSVKSQSLDSACGLWNLTLEKELKIEKRRHKNRGSLTGKHVFSRPSDGEAGRRSRSTSKTRASAVRSYSRGSPHSPHSPRSPLAKVAYSVTSSSRQGREPRRPGSASSLRVNTDQQQPETNYEEAGREATMADTESAPLISPVSIESQEGPPLYSSGIQTETLGRTLAPPAKIVVTASESEKNLKRKSIEAEREHDLTLQKLTRSSSPNPSSQSTASTSMTNVSPTSQNKKAKSAFKRVFMKLKLSNLQLRNSQIDNASTSGSTETEKPEDYSENSSADLLAKPEEPPGKHEQDIEKPMDESFTEVDKTDSFKDKSRVVSTDLDSAGFRRRPNSTFLSSQQRPVSQISQFSAFSQLSQYSLGSQLSSANSQLSQEYSLKRNSHGGSGRDRRGRPRYGRTSTSSSFSSLISLTHRHYSKASSTSSASVNSSNGGNSRENSVGDMDDSFKSFEAHHGSSKYKPRRQSNQSRNSPIPSNRRFNESAVFASSSASRMRPRRKSALAEAFSSLNLNMRNNRGKLNDPRGVHESTDKVADIPEDEEEIT